MKHLIMLNFSKITKNLKKLFHLYSNNKSSSRSSFIRFSLLMGEALLMSDLGSGTKQKRSIGLIRSQTRSSLCINYLAYSWIEKGIRVEVFEHVRESQQIKIQ